MCFTFLLYIQVPLGCVTPFAVINEYAGWILQNTMSPPPQHQQMENPNVQVLQEPLSAIVVCSNNVCYYLKYFRSRIAPSNSVINNLYIIALYDVLTHLRHGHVDFRALMLLSLEHWILIFCL